MPIQTVEHHYSQPSFWGKLQDLAGEIGKELLEKALWLYYIAQEPDVPVWVKAQIYAALGYFILPVDAIPDTIPVIGLSDDLAVLAAVVVNVAMHLTPEIRRKTQAHLDTWFGYAGG